MMYGYAGKILRIDLDQGEIRKESLPQSLVEEFIGGRGFVAKILYEELPGGIDPFDRENILVISTGPLSGHFMPASGKTHFGTKSPASGGYADANMGGHFGPALKYAGYDTLVVTGKADEPCVLLIEDRKVEIRPAQELWGKGALSVEKTLKEQYSENHQIITIGPGGENLVRFACISHDFGRQAGRTGVGAVMGAKNLKAIVVRGSGSLPVPDAKKAFEAGKKAYAAVREKPGFMGWTPEGTAGITDWLNKVGACPTRNFSASTFDAYEKINGKAILEQLKITDKGCYCCPTPCGKYGLAKTELGNAYVEGPEYESIALLGSNLELDDIHSVAYANYLCDELGLDTISAGAVCSWAMECVEKNLIDADELGFKDGFGDLKAVADMLNKIARREGIGDLLAEGVKRAAEKIGGNSSDFAIHVKGLEWSGYECRNAPGMMLAYMTADIGAHHNRAWVLGHDLAGSQANVHDLISSGGAATKLSKSTIAGKSKNVVESQHLRPLFDVLGICRLQYMELGFETEHYEELFEVITGRKMKWTELLGVSEKIWHLTRCINFREIETFGRNWDYPPQRFMTEPIPSGPNEGHFLPREEIDQLLDEYYKARGWDENGRPTDEKLKAVGLDQVIQERAGLK